MKHEFRIFFWQVFFFSSIYCSQNTAKLLCFWFILMWCNRLIQSMSTCWSQFLFKDLKKLPLTGDRQLRTGHRSASGCNKQSWKVELNIEIYDQIWDEALTLADTIQRNTYYIILRPGCTAFFTIFCLCVISARWLRVPLATTFGYVQNAINFFSLNPMALLFSNIIWHMILKLGVAKRYILKIWKSESAPPIWDVLKVDILHIERLR